MHQIIVINVLEDFVSLVTKNSYDQQLIMDLMVLFEIFCVNSLCDLSLLCR